VEPEFWHDRWRTGQIGFHQADVDELLTQCWPALDLAPKSHVFVPLCGKSLDIIWLMQRGVSVTGIELSAVAIESFCVEHGIPARRRTRADFDVYEAAQLRLFRGDFFALTPELLGEVSAVYDRAALISWTPQMRAPYLAHLDSLTDIGAKTLLITMEYPQQQMQGPPFSIGAADVDQLYGQRHTIQQLARRDILAVEHRLRARGLTELNEACYRLTRVAATCTLRSTSGMTTSL
jgi:thiopurine S-methyltransferase